MNNRRHLLIALGAAAVRPQAVLAQSKHAPVLIGWLHSGSPKDSGHFMAAFKEGMAGLGWKEGSDFILAERWAESRIAGLPALANELAAKKPTLIVAAPAPSVVAAAKAAPDTPIVQAIGGEMVRSGLVASLARPGGMITGLSNLGNETSEKFLELLLAAVPSVKRVGFLLDSGAVNKAFNWERAERSIARQPIQAYLAEAGSPEEITPAVARLAKQGAQALVVLPSSFFQPERQRIVKLALANRWPVIADSREYAEIGALLSYGPDRLAIYRRAAFYVDRILKGARPGDLPVEQPTQFELLVNLKTAKALGLTIPQPFLMRADRVIE